MRRRTQHKSRTAVVFSWLKKNAGYLRFLLAAAVMALYVCYWSTLPKRRSLPLPQEAVTIVLPENDVTEQPEPEPVVSETDEDNLSALLEQHNADVSDIAPVPDVRQVLHTSRLHKFLKEIPYEEKLPQDIVAHKKIPRKKNAATAGRDIRIAVVIDDMGGSPKRTGEITALKAPLTASFLTFAPNLPRQVQNSLAAGHEIMIHVPMQPRSDIYVSEDVLKVDMSEQEISRTFTVMLDKFHDVKGVNNHMGSRFTERGDKLAPVMKILAERGLFFLDSKTTPKSEAESAAAKYGVRYLHRHVFLDNDNDFDYITGQLRLTEKIARKNGYAIAIGHPKSQTSRALKVWLETLPAKNIRLVPLSELAETGV